MKRLLLLVVFVLLAAAASAQTPFTPDPGDNPGGTTSSTYYDLRNHGGAVMVNARVVFLFWGSFPDGYTSELQSFRGTYGGMNQVLGMLGQYGASQQGVLSSQSDQHDYANPPHVNVSTNDVTDELTRMFGSSLDSNTVYVVYLPNGYYASQSDGSTSCGGTSSQHFCGYHGRYLAGVYPIKFAVIPYASCEGCWKSNSAGVKANDVQNAEVMTIHEVRETMTNPLLSAWYDVNGLEADDKCSFGLNGTPHPENIFTVNVASGPMDTPYYNPSAHVFWFQKEYSNAVHGCVSY